MRQDGVCNRKSLTLLCMSGKILKCVRRTGDRGCIRAGEESPGFIGQDAG